MNSTMPAITPVWCVIGIDETQHWNLKPELMQHVERILTIYAFNRAVQTNCCELTPSYWLECLGYQPHVKYDAPDDIKDKIHDECSSVPWDEAGTYMHVRDVERLALSNVKWFHVYGMREDEEKNEPGAPNWLMETWSANPRF